MELRLLARFRFCLGLHKRAVSRQLPTQYEKQNNAMYDWIRQSQKREKEMIQIVQQHEVMLRDIYEKVLGRPPPETDAVAHVEELG